MNKRDFQQITTEVIADILQKFEAEGMSGNAAMAATLTMSLYASHLTYRLFDCNEIVIEKEG